MKQLAKWANEQGLTSSPSRRKRTKAETSAGTELDEIPVAFRPLNEKSVEKILHNPFYIGKLKIDDEIIDGIHQPLIDTGLFNKVQATLKSRNVKIYYVDKDFFTY